MELVIEDEDRRLVLHHGNFADWWERRERRRSERDSRGGLLTLQSQSAARDQAAAAATAESKRDAKQDREARKERQRERRRLERQVKELETAIEADEARISELEATIAHHWSDNGDPERGRALGAELDAVRAAAEERYATWEERAPRLEELSSGDD